MKWWHSRLHILGNIADDNNDKDDNNDGNGSNDLNSDMMSMIKMKWKLW